MKTYSETTKSVLKRAAAIREEKQAAAGKTRRAVTVAASTALTLALVIVAIFALNVGRERDGVQGARGSKNADDSVRLSLTDAPHDTEKTLPQSTPATTARRDESPSFITESAMVRKNFQGDMLNVERMLSMLESDGCVEWDNFGMNGNFDGIDDSAFRNITPEYIRSHTSDIELFYDYNSTYFIRIGDKLYFSEPFGGGYYYMCLWDYDENGTADLVYYISFGSGMDYNGVCLFDLSTGAFKSITLQLWGFPFDFDGKSIYINRQKVEYRDGEFFIDGINGRDYVARISEQTENPEQPKPTVFHDYAYPDIFCFAPDDFSFTIKWGVNGESSYDSETGRLVKTTNSTHPEDYVTEFFMSDYQRNAVYTDLMHHMDFFSLPDEYDPFNDPSSETRIYSKPDQSVILTIRVNGMEKTVRCEHIALGGGELFGYCYDAYTFYNKGVLGILDFIHASPEWQALPEYEFFYE